METDEELRAAEYRRMMVARERHRLARERALRAPPGPYRALVERWRPFREYLLERVGR